MKPLGPLRQEELKATLTTAPWPQNRLECASSWAFLSGFRQGGSSIGVMSLSRIITLRINGDCATGGRVPLELLAAKMKALQEAIFAVGSGMKPVLPKGSAQARVDPKKACVLLFKEIRKNCLTLEAEVVGQAESLAPDFVDLGVRAVENFGYVAQAIHEGNTDRLNLLLPGATNRAKVVRQARNLAPDGDYSTIIITPFSEVRLDIAVQDYIKQLETNLKTEAPTDRRIVVGEVVNILEKPSLQALIRVEDYFISCFIPEEKRHLIHNNLTTGTFVEVHGKALLTRGRLVKSISEVEDIRPVKVGSLKWNRLAGDDRVFLFKHPLEVLARHDGSGWVFEAPEIDVKAFADRRADAIEAFQDDFAFCYDQYAMASDDDLTPGAQALKGRFIALVERVGGPE